jgi:ATP-dependent DNA helicase RecG
MRSAIDLLHELNAVDESVRIEAKRASEIGKSVMQTIIAFANEPGLDGGYLLLGVDWSINDKGDAVYRAVGLPDPDKVQRDLASQCASMLNTALRPEMQTETVEGKTVLVVYVPEADITQKPVYLKATGLPRGAWRRIGSTDQHCVDDDLWVLRGETQPLHGPDSSVVPDARLDDFDPVAIAAYRRERSRINPQAEELDYGDEDMLEALGALRRVDGRLQPTLAGIVLFGKPLALRRLLPMVRIDYIRVPGDEWVQDPENRFQSIDIRKPLLLALPQAEASIIDELPKGFYLPEGQLHSVQEPILPRKVIREALANAVMHRSYTIHSPIQIIRYGNRIEIRNVGYSLKEPAQLGIPGSRLRNPAIAAVLHDLHLAEAKGTGIRTMRRLAAEAGLPLPEPHSDRQANEFRLTLFLHNLLTEDDHAWLRGFAGPAISADEAKALIYVRATGAVDNTACRDICGLDTLTASGVLRRLRDRGLLEKQGAGNRTYYTLVDAEQPRALVEDMGRLQESPRARSVIPPELATLPPELATFLATLEGRVSENALREGIRRLCAWVPLTVDQLATLLGKDRHYLRNKHLIPMVRDGRLRFRYPESAKHPYQAYIANEAPPTKET